MASGALMGVFILLRADTNKVAVPSGPVVERVDVVGDLLERDVSAWIDPLLDAFLGSGY
jgi:hypothetical protein